VHRDWFVNSLNFIITFYKLKILIFFLTIKNTLSLGQQDRDYIKNCYKYYTVAK
jgi:hypothetical protein